MIRSGASSPWGRSAARIPGEACPRAARLPTGEFVALVALLMSLVALSIDAMLPALPDIGRDLGVARRNDTQHVITAIFLGIALGQILFGPLSDRIGRRPTIAAGLLTYMAGMPGEHAGTPHFR